MKVEFFKHNISEPEIASITQSLHSIFLTTAGRTAEFEAQFAEFLGVKQVVGLTSCTAALHLALIALGIGPGDEVIAPAMTFVATVNPIAWVGAKPVLADVDPQTALMDLADVEQKITPATKAVICVHLYGSLVDMPRLRSICEPKGIKIIEDAAHCVEGERNGYRPGHIGDIACFSFYATKNITCGEGGAIATRFTELADQIRLLRQHGISRSAADRYQNAAYVHWDMVTLGYKYNMYDLQAALLLPQLPKVEEYRNRREAICAQYQRAFKEIEGIFWPRLPPNTVSARHLFTIWVPETFRDRLLQYLGEQGVGCAVNYRAIHILKYYQKTLGLGPEALPKALAIGNSTITLPLYVSLKAEEIDYVSQTVIKGLRELNNRTE